MSDKPQHRPVSRRARVAQRLRCALPAACALLLALLACGRTAPAPAPADRSALLPETKYGPESDPWPPTAAPGWTRPEPLPFPVNTGGGEDSPFAVDNGNTLYFFFTPDVSLPAEKQILDGVTGIWVTRRSGDAWSEPERVLLSKPGEPAGDGCPFISDSLMYFCTVRQGYEGMRWFRADLVDGRWQRWRDAGEELKQDKYQVGELHISADGLELYFGSSRAGGFGGLDLWVSLMTSAGWGEPRNLGPLVNTPADEYLPYLSPDGQELWFTGQSGKGRPGPAIFRSLRRPDGSWGKAEELFSTFAGEPALSEDGKTLYFVHHYFSQDLNTMLEADIYVSYRLP